MPPKHQSWLLLLALSLLVMGCQFFGFEIRRRATPTATPNLPATIVMLVTSNSQMSAQLATANARAENPAPTATLIPPTPAPALATPTALLPTATATVSPFPSSSPTPQPPVTVSGPAATATLLPTPPPWTATRIFFSPKIQNRLYVVQTDGANRRVLTSNNFGQNWMPLISGWPVDPACINSVNLDYNNPELFFLATCQGIFHWTTIGWTLEAGKTVGTVTNLPEQPRLLWATEPFGPTEIPVITTLNSQTWSPASRYLEHTTGVAELLFDPTDPTRLFATVWPDFPGSLLRRGAANGQWDTLPAPPATAPIDLTIVPDGVTGALYATTGGGQLWRSPNPNSPDPSLVRWELVYESSRPLTLLGGSWPNNQFVLFANLGGAPHYSLDAGQSWALLPIPGSV